MKLDTRLLFDAASRKVELVYLHAREAASSERAAHVRHSGEQLTGRGYQMMRLVGEIDGLSTLSLSCPSGLSELAKL